jgi:hypothetical protein
VFVPASAKAVDDGRNRGCQFCIGPPLGEATPDARVDRELNRRPEEAVLESLKLQYGVRFYSDCLIVRFYSDLVASAAVAAAAVGLAR